MKYEVYRQFDKVVYNEIGTQGSEVEAGVIEIDWSQIDTNNFTLESSSEPTDAITQSWTVV